jgi:hypothetical protein
VASARRSIRLAVVLAVAIVAALALAPGALAADGEGLVGRTDDKLITLFCLGVVLFFPVLVTVLSIVQGRLEARKERRRYDLERLS